MTLRPAPGPQLASGRLRVDATKAIAKLREYQLVDRTAWILEAIRAAVAAGATSIDLQGDSNDVWLSWTGEPWPAADLPRLFDELVSPEPDASRHHVRLLAAAVNSALGANPAYIDIYTIAGDGAQRVRYTPDVLVAPEGEFAESPLQRVQVQPASVPQGASRGMQVHFRRRTSLEVVSYWLRLADPPELAMARSACVDIATPIRIGEAVLDRTTHGRDVVQLPFGDDVEGWMAVTTRLEDGVPFELAERGVLLETTTIDLRLGELRPLPLRVFVDGDRMPTNASRSEVRRDTHPVSTAERRARELIPQLIDKLVERCKIGGEPHARSAAIHLLAGVIGGEGWAMRAREIPPPLRALAELPLVRDATGVPRPLTWTWSGIVHRGSEPLEAELAPWLSQVLWAPPGDPAFTLQSGWIHPYALKDLVKLAKRERRAEKRFYKHASREPRVLDRRKPRVRARLGAPLPGSCIPDDAFEGFTGEICVYRDRRGSELVVLLAGREIETIGFDGPLSFAAVIDSPRVKPTNRYRGIERDAEYARLERAMKAGVVRAIEAVALAASGKFVDGYQVAVDAQLEFDTQLVRDGLRLARSLGVPVMLAPVFVTAKIWRSTVGYVSLDDLRAHSHVGVAPAYSATIVPPEGRLIVFADAAVRELLCDLVPAGFVPYEPARLAARITPDELAPHVMGSSPHALAFAEDGLVVVMVPGATPHLALHHRGVRLGLTPYTPMLAPCAIAIDSDRIVPDEDWGEIRDDGGLTARDYAGWERRFARTIASAMLGYREPTLIGDARVEIGGPLGRWLCESLLAHASPATILGDELLAGLRTCSLFRVLGEPRAHSIDELAVMFPDTVLHVDFATDPVDGFPVLFADTLVARTIAKLAGRKHRNATEELARRRAQLARELRLGMHRAKPLHPLEVAGTHVSIKSTLGNAVVGVGRDTLELQVLVEGRLFLTVTRPQDLPLAAVFDLTDLTRIDDKFEKLAPGFEDLLVGVVRAKCPDLFTTIAEHYPEAFADAGPRRALLARFLGRHALPKEAREVLARTIRFPTVQGGRATVIEARTTGIQTCAWTGEWLAADGDETALDKPVLLVGGSPEVGTILSAFGTTVDVTRSIERLQTQRRIARGLLPVPRVPLADPELVRPLSQLGTSFHHLGLGEIALVPGPSEVLLHTNGELQARVRIDCLPSVHLAIEAADLVDDRSLVERRLGAELRQLAVLLVQRILLERSPDTLSFDIRRNLRRAILAGRLPGLRELPVFETAKGLWIDLAAVQAQRELFGNLWCVPFVPPDAEPLDDRRIVLVLSVDEQRLAHDHGIPVVDATTELAYDAITRKNMARQPAESLAIEVDGVLAEVAIDGDGISGPRGTVAVLSPTVAHRRGLRLLRAMHPFDGQPDPCRWPTVAVIDDARFTPERLWDAPARDDIYKGALEVLHRASNEALRLIVPPPAHALASIRAAPWTYDTVVPLRNSDIQIRGALWLEGAPVPAIAPTVRVFDQAGERSFVPLRGPGVAGTLYVHAPSGWQPDLILEALCTAMHGKLVRELAAARKHDPDLVAAHVAWALALERITPDDAKHVRFACFRPGPLDATALHAILMAKAPVTVIAPDSKYDGSALLDDGSETARVIKAWLGERLQAPAQRRRPDTVEPPPPPRPAVEHPLQPFVNKLHARIMSLGVQVSAWRIVDDRDQPIAAYHANVLELAAGHRHVIEIAASCAANTAWSRDALDALAAHCITVLNVALSQITDATEARAIAKLLG